VWIDDPQHAALRARGAGVGAPAAARRVAAGLGIADLRAGLLPADKVSAVRELMARGGGLAMVGDGINDTPALAQASLGIAVGGPGNASAMETADVVLLGGSLERLPFAVRVARLARALIRQNVVFALVTKLIFILLAVNGVATMWMAVVADTGVSLLVTLNALRPFALKAALPLPPPEAGGERGLWR